jgi:hypothetical protein
MTRREERLKADGWTRRGEASEPRLSETIALYKELGFEVLHKPLDDEEKDDGCRVCFNEDPSLYKVIYTRKKEDPSI